MKPSLVDTLPSQKFQPRIYGVGAWTDNIHFAYDLVATMRPRVLVELGVDRGESYFAFCQSVAENRTSTRCFGIDAWEGDAHVGGYDETTFRVVEAHNEQRYATFSRLIRKHFAAAASDFGEEEIDLLHIDGLHTEEAVRSDIEAWMPKLRPGGVLLMHDVSVRTRDFAVWKVWEELRMRGRFWTFEKVPGLGVWQKPPANRLPDPLETFLTAPNESSEVLADYYRAGGARVQQQIASDWATEAVRRNAIGTHTLVQVFYTHDGSAYSEDTSVLARVGHGEWKELRLSLPEGASVATLRIDFVSPFTTIEIAAIDLIAGGTVLFHADTSAAFDCLQFAGDLRREAHESYLQLKVTGIDPQIYLPRIEDDEARSSAVVKLRLRVLPGE